MFTILSTRIVPIVPCMVDFRQDISQHLLIHKDIIIHLYQVIGIPIRIFLI